MSEDPTISYIGALDSTVPDGVAVVSGALGYLQTCKQMEQGAGVAWVRDRAIYNWLVHYANLIGWSGTFGELTPRSVLAAKWRVEVPSWLDDVTIVSQKLLELTEIPKGCATFTDTMLLLAYGENLAVRVLDPDKLGAIVLALADPKDKTFANRYPVIGRCIHEKTEQWAAGNVPAWLGAALTMLESDPTRLWRSLSLWKLLSGYPEKLLEYALPPDTVSLLRSVPVSTLSGLKIEGQAREQAVDQIKVFFAEVGTQINSLERFAKLLNRVSGLLREEFSLLENVLQTQGIELDLGFVDRIRQKFEPCQGVPESALRGLRRFVAHPIPLLPLPLEEMSEQSWAEWAVKAYMPYRLWQIQTGHANPMLEDQVQAFSRWYVDQYETIHSQADKSLVHVLTSWREQFLEDDLSLVLVVDCLPFFFWDLMERAMREAGLHRRQLSYRFAPLPSHTEASKPRLLSGTWESDPADYDSILKKRAQHEWNGKNVAYVPALSGLYSQAMSPKAGIVVLNYLPGDELLHQDVEASGGSWDEEMSRLFKRLADTVGDICTSCAQDQKKVSVYVVTDHGATKSLPDELKTFDSQVVQSMFPNEKHRFGYIDECDESVPDNVWALGARFVDPFKSDERAFFIPLGHNGVGRNYTAFSHGGATPEEVIVPAAIFSPVKILWKAPSARFLQLRFDQASRKAIFHILRVVPVEIEVQNINNEDLVIRQAFVLEPANVDVKDVVLGTAPAQSACSIALQCYFGKEAMKQDSLVIQLKYAIAGEERTLEIKTPALFKSAATGGFNLNDL